MDLTTRQILICVLISFCVAGFHCSILKNRKFRKHIWVSLVFTRDLWSFLRVGFVFAVLDASKISLRNYFHNDLSFCFSISIIATDVDKFVTAGSRTSPRAVVFKRTEARKIVSKH